MTPLLRYEDAARVLGIHPHTLSAYVARGEIATVRMGRRVGFLERDLEAFITQRRRGATVAPVAVPASPPAADWTIGTRGRKGTRSA